MNRTEIKTTIGRRVWDSRGRPTVEVEIRLLDGSIGRAIAPAGASTGSGEALDRRDGGARLDGWDVQGAVASVNEDIAQCLRGRDASDQAGIDAALIELDGRDDKGRLGGNALVATSMAVAHAAAGTLPLWQHLGGDREFCLPLPEIQIFGGGAHASRRVDFQDFMIVPIGAPDFATALDWVAEVYLATGRLLAKRGILQGVADEGGYWPSFSGNEPALEMLVRAIEGAGLVPGQDMAISLDIAASQFYSDGLYHLASDDKVLDADGLSSLLLGWLERYPIVMIEDPLVENDHEGFVAFTRAAGSRVQIVGDDYLVTNAGRVAAAAADRACNAVLIKPNQAGTLTEARAAFVAARKAGFGAIVSARSGESEDTTIVHLAVGWGALQLKVGSITRGERTAKWNEGLRIAEALDCGGRLPDPKLFPWGQDSDLPGAR
jgi:enolase